MITTFASILIGNIIKKTLLIDSKDGIKILFVILIGFINIILVYLFEKKNYLLDLNEKKLFQ